MIFINNFYPANFDDKCMGWTWFVSCYIQLSILLPLLIAIYQVIPRKFGNILYAALMIVAFVINAALIVSMDTGIFLKFDDNLYLNNDFYALIFMRPYFHFNSYLWGVILCIAFLRYVQEKVNPNSERNSLSSRIFTFIRANGKIRYPMYLVGLLFTLWPLLGLHGYLADNSSWNHGLQAIYGSLAYPLFAFAMSLFILPALLGRAEFRRFFFGGEIWIIFKQVAYGLYLYVPIYALGYFLSMSNAQHLDYQMMFYNFCGIFIFSLIFVQLFTVLFERPFIAMLNFKNDIKLLDSIKSNNPEAAFNINNYMLKDGLMGEEGKPIQNNSNMDISGRQNAIQEKSTTLFDFSNTQSPSRMRDLTQR